MNEQKVAEFLQWLPSQFQEFQDKSLDEISDMLNTMYEQSDEGKQMIETLWSTFMTENQPETTMFKQGGKLDSFVQKFAKGGSTKKTCSCGCAMHNVFEKGGVISKCACGCKVTKDLPKQEERKEVRMKPHVDTLAKRSQSRKVNLENIK